MATLGNDTFDDTNGVFIESHTPFGDVVPGIGSWEVKHNARNEILSNKVQSNQINSGHVRSANDFVNDNLEASFNVFRAGFDVVGASFRVGICVDGATADASFEGGGIWAVCDRISSSTVNYSIALVNAIGVTTRSVLVGAGASWAGFQNRLVSIKRQGDQVTLASSFGGPFPPITLTSIEEALYDGAGFQRLGFRINQPSILFTGQIITLVDVPAPIPITKTVVADYEALANLLITRTASADFEVLAPVTITRTGIVDYEIAPKKPITKIIVADYQILAPIPITHTAVVDYQILTAVPITKTRVADYKTDNYVVTKVIQVDYHLIDNTIVSIRVTKQIDYHTVIGPSNVCFDPADPIDPVGETPVPISVICPEPTPISVVGESATPVISTLEVATPVVIEEEEAGGIECSS